MQVKQLITELVNFRQGLLYRIEPSKIASIKNKQDVLQNKLKLHNYALARIGNRFLSTLNLDDPRFWLISDKKNCSFPFDRYLKNILTNLANAKYDQFEDIIQKMNIALEKIDVAEFKWTERPWRKYNILKALSEKLAAKNIIKNHLNLVKKFPKFEVSFKLQKHFLIKQTSVKANRLMVKLELSLLNPELFELWQENLEQNFKLDIILTSEFSRIIKKIYTPLPSDSKLNGIFVDPKLVVSRSLKRWFDEDLEIPNVEWNKNYNTKTLASMNFFKDQIKFSAIFDIPSMDLEILDFLAYHELLHRHTGVRLLPRKTLAHSKKFRALEMVYPEAKKIERQLLNFVKYGA